MDQDTKRYRVRDSAVARLHRLNIGTITAAPAITVRFVRGAVLGHVEETFISQLKPKDVFFFSGRQLEFVRLRDMTAYVKVSTKKTRTVPAWAGGQMALSDLLTHHLRQEVDRASRGDLDTPELEALAPLFERQQDLSVLPRADQLLIETCKTREGTHLYAYPFEGRFVHEGIGFLWASRLTRLERGTITVSVNDYGFELLAPKTYPMEELLEDHSDQLLDRKTPGARSAKRPQPLGTSTAAVPRHRTNRRVDESRLSGVKQKHWTTANQRFPAVRCVQSP